MRQAPRALVELVRNVVEPMGYEFVGLDYVQPGKGEGLLRLGTVVAPQGRAR